jgi:serine/threonine protein kinase
VRGQPAVPFHSTFRFCFAFIDFGNAVQFSPDATDHLITAEHMPPSQVAAPEQTQDEPYDIFASDVFNVGRVLQNELEESKEVCILFAFFLLLLIDIDIGDSKAREPSGN